MGKIGSWSTPVLSCAVLLLTGGGIYLWSLNARLTEQVGLISADLASLRAESPTAEAGKKDANGRALTKDKVRSQPAARRIVDPNVLQAGGNADVVGGGGVAKMALELPKTDKKSRSDRYSGRVRADLEAYAAEQGLPKVTVDEAMLIIEAWAEDRKFYKDSVQSGDLSKDEARDETRAGLDEVQEQLRIIFGDRHMAALDETISFLARLPGAREGVPKTE